MKYLIDTHILIWYALNDTALSPKITELIKNLDNQIFLSKVKTDTSAVVHYLAVSDKIK